MEPLKDIERHLASLCQEVRWRTRANRVLARVGPMGALALWILALGLAADALLLFSRPLAPWCAIGGGVLWLGALVLGWMEPITDLTACQRLDKQADLEGRLANARSFLAAGPRELSPMEQAAVRDGARALLQAEPRAVEPLRPPSMSWWLVGAVVACVLSVFLSRTVPTVEAPGLTSLQPPPAPSFRVHVKESHDLRQLEADARDSERAAARAGDSQVREWLEALNQLIEDVASGRLSAERAHARIAALERAQEAWEDSTGDAAKVEEHLRSAAARTSRPTKHLKSTVDALRAAQWAEAAQGLEQAAQNAEEHLSRSSRRRLSRGLEALAKRLETERQRSERRARKERRRLQKKEKKRGRLSRKDRRRLDRQRRTLDKLQRQRTQMGEMERTLERLQREVDEAARASQRGQEMDPDLAKALQRAADAMRRVGDLSQGRRQMRVSRARLKDLRELLRRAARGQGKAGKPGGRGGQEGEDGRARFIRLAMGQKGQQGGQGEGSSSSMELAPGAGEGGASLQMEGGEAAGQSSDSVSVSPGGNEAGDGVDSQIYGEAEHLDVQVKSDHVSGKEGEGASQTRVVLSAARGGFVNDRYKAVHQDYSRVEEEAMERQHIPAGRRQYVREYFDLIRPR